MAKYKNPYKGKNDTPSGVLPEDQAIRFGLTDMEFAGATDKSFRRSYKGNRNAKYLFRLVSTYRQKFLGVNETRLPQTLRDAVHYLISPMSKSYSGAVSPQEGEAATTP